MFERDDIFIANRWVRSAGDEWLDVTSPTTEEIVGRVPAATTADVDAAVAAARSAFEEGPWPRLSFEERVEALQRVADEFDVRAAEAVDLQIDEMGGIRRHMDAITTKAVSGFLALTLADAELVKFREIRKGFVGDVVVLREPIGVVGGITPWNGPVLSAAQKLFPALLMGCPIVIKQAPESPLSAYPLAEAVAAAGLPEGTVSIFSGSVAVGRHLVGHEGVDKVAFTGS
ncbi:MAG: aldehyde dehydrogenase family protein, partial [Acidimicrobiia bacterium]